MGNYWSSTPSLDVTNENYVSRILEITTIDFDEIIDNNELVLLYFYTSWSCEDVHPVFEETAKCISERYPDRNVIIGRIDADKEPFLAKNKKRYFRIRFFPTIKLFYKGRSKGVEYRGRRTVGNLVKLIEICLDDPVAMKMADTNSW